MLSGSLSLAGRTAVAVIGGNVSDYSYSGFDVTAFVGLECFDKDVTVTYRAEFYCGTNTLLNVSECHPEATFNGTVGRGIGIDPGDPNAGPVLGACAVGTDPYDPAGLDTNSNSTAPEPGAPADPGAPPSDMPVF